jgi:hypothetical protein
MQQTSEQMNMKFKKRHKGKATQEIEEIENTKRHNE